MIIKYDNRVRRVIDASPVLNFSWYNISKVHFRNGLRAFLRNVFRKSVSRYLLGICSAIFLRILLRNIFAEYVLQYARD